MARSLATISARPGGTPIAFCLGIASFATVVYLGLPPLVVFQRVASGISVFTLMAIAPQWFARGADPRSCDLANSRDTPSAEHWFGFDQQGCDYLANVAYGARVNGLASRRAE